jgi:uncharacterized membrane protein YhaH (DUF805 family)
MRVLRILFSLEGRINRLQFWLTLLGIAAFTTVMFTAIEHLRGNNRPALAVVFTVWLGIFIWTMVAVSTKRWHDMDLSGLMSLLWLIPFVGPLIVIGWLGFGPGKTGVRRHRRRSSHSGFQTTVN